jgi:hypothetical protein
VPSKCFAGRRTYVRVTCKVLRVTCTRIGGTQALVDGTPPRLDAATRRIEVMAMRRGGARNDLGGRGARIHGT